LALIIVSANGMEPSKMESVTD